MQDRKICVGDSRLSGESVGILCHRAGLAAALGVGSMSLCWAAARLAEPLAIAAAGRGDEQVRGRSNGRSQPGKCSWPSARCGRV
jgi:hypothetical protein